MIDPLASFEVRNIIPIHVGRLDLSITNSSLYMLLVVILICSTCLFGLRDERIVPSKLRFCIERMYFFLTNLVKQQVGDNANRLFPYIFSLFLFIMLGNMIGLIPYAFSFTTQLVVTMGISLLIWIASIIIGLLVQGKSYFRHFCPKGLPVYIMPFFTLIELMSFCFRPISLGIRLFANMVSGHIMIKVMASFAISLASVIVLSPIAILPVLVNVFLNVFKLVVCLLQAYVFSVLSCIYLSESLESLSDSEV